MKKILLGVFLLPLTLFYGCTKNNTEKQNDKFYDALTDLSLQDFQFDSSTKGTGDAPSYEEYVSNILDYIQNHFSSIVPPSCNEGTNYYQNINENDIINTGAFDLIDLYGTEEFSDILYYTLYEGRSYSVDDIYDNESLRPNEKVAAVLLLCFDTDENPITKASNPCLDAYDSGMAKCRKLNYIRVGISGAISLANPALGVLCTVASVIDNDTCTGNVEAAYRDCLG